MFPQIQNVVSARDLFSSNPGRELWDSQQFSQTGSGSQGSQQSSLELFSQSRASQQPKNCAYDSWSTSANSQQAFPAMNEEDPVKYYMRYMSKPPLFPDQSSKQSMIERNQTVNFKEYMDVQKKKTTERDQRDLLDNFIGLLKDYTKEVQSAMSSFKDSISSTMATNVEQIASAADKSVDIVAKIKEDFAESFNILRKDLQENEELKNIIAKHEVIMARKEEEFKLLNDQLEQFRKRESKALEREEKYLQREQQLLEKLREAEAQRQSILKDTPLPSQNVQSAVITEPVTHPNPSFPINILHTQPLNNPAVRYQQQSCPWSHEVSVRNADQNAGVLVNQNANGPCTRAPPMAASEELQYSRLTDTMTHKDLQCHAVSFPIGRIEDSIPRLPPYFNIVGHHTQPMMPYVHPTAAVVPVQNAGTCQVATQISSATVLPQSSAGTAVLHHSSTLSTNTVKLNSVPAIQEAAHHKDTITPESRALALVLRDKRPKKSPIATVLPQMHVKQEDMITIKKCSNPKKNNEDPWEIFIFDLTNSPATDDPHQVNEPQFNTKQRSVMPTSVGDNLLRNHKTSNHKEQVQPKSTATSLKMYATRSHSKMAKASDQDKEDLISRMESPKNASLSKTSPPSKMVNSVKRKVYAGRGLGTSGNDKKRRTETNHCFMGKWNSPGPLHYNPRSNNEIAGTSDLHISKISGKPFRRNKLKNKRTLNFSCSSMFEIMDEEVSIQQITESIRKHTQKRKQKITTSC